MFNLTSKKYYFFGVSLLVIIPGFIFLLFYGLNPGIDFTGGTTVDLRFQNALSQSTANPIAAAFANTGNAKDVKVYYAQQVNTAGAQIFWVQLNVPVDNAVQTEILNRLTAQSSVLGTVKALSPLDQASINGGPPFALLAFQITPPSSTSGGAALKITPAQVGTIITAKPLPNTTIVSSGSTTTTPTATVAPTVTVAPTATIAPTATVAPTPVATGTPAASGSGSTSSGSSTTTLPVKLVKVFAGTTNQIVTVQTQTLLTPQTLQNVESVLLTKYGVLYQSQAQTVGPSIAGSTTILSIIAVIAASVAILIYIGIAFRKVGGRGRSLRFGVCALVALLHDVLVVLGVWAILGHYFPTVFKVDTLFVTAVLTVIGFSVHDTIVVFDRIRENEGRRTSENFNDIVNASLLQTMARSINTSLTVLVTLLSLTLFVGDAIRPFTLALLVGIFSGTYSSIFNASMLLVGWETGEWSRNKTAAVAVRPTRRVAGANAQ